MSSSCGSGAARWRFPRHADGRWGGYYPADSQAAIDHLEELRFEEALSTSSFPRPRSGGSTSTATSRSTWTAATGCSKQGESCLIYDIRANRAAGTQEGSASPGEAGPPFLSRVGSHPPALASGCHDRDCD